jgi:hypothetical protein
VKSTSSDAVWGWLVACVRVWAYAQEGRTVDMSYSLGFCSSHLSYDDVNDTVKLLELKKAYLAIATCQTERDDISMRGPPSSYRALMYSPSSS